MYVDPLSTRADAAQEGEELEENETEVETEAEEEEEEERKRPDSAVEASRKYQVIGTVLDREVTYPEVVLFTLINGTFSSQRSITQSGLALFILIAFFPPPFLFPSVSLPRRMAISGNLPFSGCPVNSANVSICPCRAFASSSLVYLSHLIPRIIHLLVSRYRHQQQNERVQETRGRDLA